MTGFNLFAKLEVVNKDGMAFIKNMIKYYKPTWDIKDIQIGEELTFKWGIAWRVIGKTKSGYLKLEKC
uniref:Uncharacterized protein n=2 Tax=viral metagenome TaxID=1070528 RepID=A0A6M3XPJ5_9ZZZZ